jgi:1-pyrroline-4-hydroxy-2-carboxylate deaminase
VELYRWFTPLLHLDTHPKLVQYIKLAVAECGYGTETCRPPRLPLAEPERSQILAIIRRAIKTRPATSTKPIAAAT